MRAGRGWLFTAMLGLACSAPAPAAPGYALYGKPKYGEGYAHFDYVNPDAPKRGTLVLSQISAASNFDKLNPYSLRGRVAPGALDLMFETLADYSLDEVTTQYGVLADDIEVAPDFRSVTFRLHPRARFSNGDPVTAEDVKYSFEVLTGGKASPNYASFFSEIRGVAVVDDRHVRFDFKRRGRDLPFIAGQLPVFSPKWGLKEDGTRVGFDALRKEPPIATGPYRVERIDEGKGITYRRNPDWWGADAPARRGMFNFDRVQYKLYKDGELQIESFRAGDFDVVVDARARSWCCRYTGKRFADGTLVKRIFPHRNPPSMNGTIFNTRRAPYDDIRVRKALNLAYDFEWINDRIFHGDYKRVDSYFVNTELAARGLPTPAELKLLEPWRDQLDPAVFGPPPQQPSTYSPSSFRDNLEQALALMAEAGWHYRDGALRNDEGEPFRMEVTIGDRLPLPFVEGYIHTLTRLGIQIERRNRDPVETRKRLAAFDFDSTSLSLRESRIPGSELLRSFGSEAAVTPGSENIGGIRSPVVDDLLHKLLDAESEEELVAAARALDRVLLHGHYVVPWRYNFEHRVAYNSRLAYPERLPDYYEPTRWALSVWWEKDTADGVQSARHGAAGRPSPTDG